MFPFHKQSKSRLMRLVAVAILASFTWQLGSCPCGCFEHNAWVQMFVSNEHAEVRHDEQSPASTRDDSPVIYRSETSLLACEHDHERCTGGQASYLDNSRTDSLSGASRTVTQAVAGSVHFGHHRCTVPIVSQFNQHRSPVKNTFQHSRSALQVYLI
jgi:hypothetical protein